MEKQYCDVCGNETTYEPSFHSISIDPKRGMSSHLCWVHVCDKCRDKIVDYINYWEQKGINIHKRLG